MTRDEQTATSFVFDAVLENPIYRDAFLKARNEYMFQKEVTKLHGRWPIKGLRDDEDYYEYEDAELENWEEAEPLINLGDW